MKTPSGGDPNQSADAGWIKFVGMGIELAGVTLGIAAFGYLADGYFRTAKPYGTGLGTMVGFTFGLFRFIQRAMKNNRP